MSKKSYRQAINEALRDVLATEQQQRFRRIAVAAGAADLLVIMFDGFRELVVNDSSNVWNIETHAECIRRENDR